jgi:hypothetical protein
MKTGYRFWKIVPGGVSCSIGQTGKVFLSEGREEDGSRGESHQQESKVSKQNYILL